MGDSRFGRQEQHPGSFLSGESIPSLLRLPDPASVPISDFYDAATAVGRGLESFLAASVVDIYCHRERGSTLHEYLLIRFHLDGSDAWARVDRAPVHGTKYISVQSPMARDTIKLSNDKNTLQKGDQDTLIEHRIFQSHELPLFHLLHLLKIIHLEQPKYRLFSTNCWWLARMVRQTLGHHYGQAPYSPKQHPFNVFLKILGKDVAKHTEKIIRQYGDFLRQSRLSQPAFHFPYAPAYYQPPFYAPSSHPPGPTPPQMNPPIYPSLHPSYQANIPAYGWATSPWFSTHPFAGPYIGSSPVWMNPPYLNSRMNDVPDVPAVVTEIIPPSYPSGRSPEDQTEKDDTLAQTTAIDALTGTPTAPVSSDLLESYGNEKGGEPNNSPNSRRRRRRRRNNNRNRSATPADSRPITPSSDHAPPMQDLAATKRKRVRGSKPATRAWGPLASGQSPPSNVQGIPPGIAQAPPSSSRPTFNSRTPKPRPSKATPRSLPKVASEPSVTVQMKVPTLIPAPPETPPGNADSPKKDGDIIPA